MFFPMRTERLKLEAILHPLIRDVSFRLAEEAKGDYVIFVNPLLVELPIWRGMGTRVLVVDCPEELQVSRVMKRSNMTAGTGQGHYGHAATREKRLAMADDVIENNRSIGDTSREVEHLHAIYKKMAQNAFL